MAFRVPVIFLNIGSDNGLLPDGTNPLPELTLIYHYETTKNIQQCCFCGNAYNFNKIHLKFTVSQLESLFTRTIESAFLTHWGRVTHKCVSKLTIIGSDNGLSPDRRQAIIWTNVGLLLIRPLGKNFSEILIEILTFSFKKMRLKMSSVKRRPFCLSCDNSNICTTADTV